MRKEEKVILLGVLRIRTEQEEKELKDLLKQSLDWVYIVGMLMRHRLSGNFYEGVKKRYSERLNPKIKSIFSLLSEVYEELNRTNLEALSEILQRLEEKEIKAAGLKGVVFNTSIYDLKTRMSNDVDILVSERNLKQLDKVMRELGYIQSSDKGITEASKKDKLIQIMNYHDLVPYYKNSNSIFNKPIQVDVNIHFDRKEHDITTRVLDYGTHIYSSEGYSIVGLNWKTHLLHLCVHYYREATNSLWLRNGRSVDLYKLVDIENTFRTLQEQELDEWYDVIVQFELEKECYFCLYNLEQFFPSKRNKYIMERLHLEDKSFLNKMKVEGSEEEIVIEGNIYDRTFNCFF